MFMYAVKTNNEQLIDLMIDKGYDIYSKDPHGYPTILHWACSQYMYWEKIGSSVPKLIELGVDPNTQGGDGYTPLYHAVKNRQVDAVKNLLRYGADPDLGSPGGITPIFNVDNLEILNALIDAGADCHKKTTMGEYCLNTVVMTQQTQRTDIVKRLLEVGCEIDHQQNNGNSPLHYCTSSHDQEVAQLLLAHGANPNLCDVSGATPIVNVSDVSILTALAEAGADLDHANDAGQTCLFKAVTYNKVDLIKRMIELGCDVNHQDNEGCTPLFYVKGDDRDWTRATSPNLKVAKLLLENGSDPNHQDNSGATPIQKVDDIFVLNALVRAGADVHSVDHAGQTCLFNAVRNIKVDLVKRMINLRCDINHQDNEGSTPLFYCDGSDRIWDSQNSLHLEIAILLLEAGADPGIKDNENYRAFEYEGTKDLEQLLIENEYIVYSEDDL